MKLGSLFDGSGGFPLAGSLCGFEPVWASEVEPYPIAVTRSRFPKMKHLGDISKINGAEIEPVDIITFGSPCQDLSVAGKRAGLKHEANGDEETTRSGLFMEAVRIIKEMREATNGRYPTFALWENVPGAFSSNKGEDFRIVLEELIKIVEPTAVMPSVPKNGWPYADSYLGNEWSIAYRVFDAQYWGVPQRRRRIHLVLDLRGERARSVLFEREGLRGYFEESREARKEASRDADGCVGTADSENGIGIDTPVVCYDIADRRSVANESVGVSPTLRAETHGNLPCVLEPVTYDSRGNGDGKIVSTITGDHNNRVTDYTSLVLNPVSTYWDGSQTAGTLTANNAGGNQRMPDKENFNCVIEQREAQIYRQGGFAEYIEGEVGTLRAVGGGSENLVATQYIVRRLTPTECARLQGFPDMWGHPDKKDDFTDEEYAFWLEVRNTHAAINGKAVKDYTKEQMVKWYNKLHTDSAEYKMWGNGIALPPALYCMQGIEEAMK